LEKQTNRNIQKNIKLILTGIFLIIFVFGSAFSINLIKYSLWILIAFTLILYYYFDTVFLNWFTKEKIKKRTQIFGFIGTILLLLFFGMQLTQLPFKGLFFIVGIIMASVGSIKLFKIK